MEKLTEVKHILEWTPPHCGYFKATVINGNITELNMCEEGNKVCLTSTNESYLRRLHESLGELLVFMAEEQKRLGYSFGDDLQSKE